MHSHQKYVYVKIYREKESLEVSSKRFVYIQVYLVRTSPGNTGMLDVKMSTISCTCHLVIAVYCGLHQIHTCT